MKIAFVWYYDKASEIFPNWRDGLRAALEEIGKEHELVWFMDKELPNPLEFDFILVWDDSNTPVPRLLGNKATRMGLCLTTWPTNIDNLKNFEVIYCESDPIVEEIKKHGLRAIKAFGTDTNFFTNDNTQKDIEYFYPATFSPWKNQKSIAKLGKELYCVGTIQPDGQEEYKSCIDQGVNVEVGYFPAEHIRDLYRRTKFVILPAQHGSERTVLESSAMGIPIIVTYYTNDRILSLIDNIKDHGMSEFTTEAYASALLKGMK